MALIARASSSPDPVPDATLHLRNWAPAINGAEAGVLTVGNCFAPRATGVVERGRLCGVAVDLPDRIVAIYRRDALVRCDALVIDSAE